METGKSFLTTFLWGIAAGMGLRIGWGLIEFILSVFQTSVGKT